MRSPLNKFLDCLKTRFFCFFCIFSFFSVCFETDLFVSVVSKRVRNKPKKIVFGFAKQTENQPKQIEFRFVSVRTENIFCLFWGHPNPTSEKNWSGLCIPRRAKFFGMGSDLDQKQDPFKISRPRSSKKSASTGSELAKNTGEPLNCYGFGTE
jgi:hypothetical protein